MSPYALHPLPSRRAVVREQVRTVGLSLRREGLVLAGLLTAFSLFIAWIAANGANPALPFVPAAAIPLLIVALLVPMAVWKGEDPARRLYHWSMPVAQGEHALAKAFSGWTWTMAAMAGYLVWALGMALATGGSIGVEPLLDIRRVEDLHMTRAAVEPWRWVVPFTGATVLYLFGSALVLATRYPARWLGGGVVGFMFLSAMQINGEPNPLLQAVRWAWTAPLGLQTALSGKVPEWAVSAELSHIYRTPDVGAWFAATWLWLALALSLFLFAAYRQPEK